MFGDLWKRPDLSARDRSIATLAVLIGRNQASALSDYLNLALDSGVTASEISLDLGLVLPAAVLTGVLLARRQPWGFVLGAYFLVKFTTLGLAIMAMSVFIVANGQPQRASGGSIHDLDVVIAVLAWWFLSSVSAPARPFGLLRTCRDDAP